ncbi:MAG: EF-hand domain-containing protein [Mariprofundaceae bacterium]|nr:EF-hand domain-containing protein [Mariprofundaceae bacterium]
MKFVQYKKVIGLILAAAFASTVTIGMATASPHDGEKGKKGYHFKMIDSNGDGKISAEEHAIAAAKRFSKMDTNGDGFVSKKEMRKHHKKMKKKHAKPCNKS